MSPEDVEEGFTCPDDLESWISDVSVEVWTINEKIDFEVRNKKPVYHLMEFKAQTLLNENNFI